MVCTRTNSQHALTLWLCLVSGAIAEDVISTTTGPSRNRVDVVFVGDGYQADELDTYHKHLDGAIDYMFFGIEQPFSRYRNFFNFHRIEVISQESGADIAPDDVFVDTALGAKYFFDGTTERLLSINVNSADTIVNRSIGSIIGTGEIDMRFATVNSTKYGGAGGKFATFAGGNDAAFEVALHEIAHSFSNLADEYFTPDTIYTGSEPSSVNVTADPSGLKWERWLGYEEEGVGPIGAFEGARYYETGLYRPSDNSKMRNLNRPFDAVSREQLVLDIYEHVEPIDSNLSLMTELGYNDEAWLTVVDPDIIDVRWSINDFTTTIPDSQFAINQFVELGLPPGEYVLHAEAVDNTEWIRLEDQRPRQTLAWNVSYFPGDFNDDKQVDSIDMDMLTAAVLGGENDMQFDMTQDALVDQSDRDRWVAANQTIYGDLDLNGTVDFADFLTLSSNFATNATGWADGNFDGLGGVDFADFLQLSANFGLTSANVATVPEPDWGSGMLAILLACVLTLHRRSRRT